MTSLDDIGVATRYPPCRPVGGECLWPGPYPWDHKPRPNNLLVSESFIITFLSRSHFLICIHIHDIENLHGGTSPCSLQNLVLCCLLHRLCGYVGTCGLMVRASVSRPRGCGFEPLAGQHEMSLGKALMPHCSSLPSCKWVPSA